MTHSGGKPHNVGDKGQRYEVTFFDGEKRRVFGWSDTPEGCQPMMRSIEAHPVWKFPHMRDREAKEAVDLPAALSAIFALMDEADSALDKETYDQHLRGEFDLPDDCEMWITAGTDRKITKVFGALDALRRKIESKP